MFARMTHAPGRGSLLLFGPRGTGKSTWAKATWPEALYLDLLDAELHGELLTRPERFEPLVLASGKRTIIVDEIQRLPDLLNQVHRLIESHHLRFVLTGSSARKLRRGGANLLAGRAHTETMHPLTAFELGKAFDLKHSMRFGQLPTVYGTEDAERYLRSYVGTYLREEVQAEALTRNLQAFSRFVVASSFSQAGVLSVSEVSRELGLARKTVEGYFDLLEDLLLSVRLPVFTRRAKRALTAHPKFYWFDAGVFRALRPLGPLDSAADVDGAALETLVLQELRAHRDRIGRGDELYFWRTRDQHEVDFVLYGPSGLVAIEVTRSGTFREGDLSALRLFRQDYPMARCFLFYGGARAYRFADARVLPLTEALPNLADLLTG